MKQDQWEARIKNGHHECGPQLISKTPLQLKKNDDIRKHGRKEKRRKDLRGEITEGKKLV